MVWDQNLEFSHGYEEISPINIFNFYVSSLMVIVTMKVANILIGP